MRKYQEGSLLDDTLTKMDLYTAEFDGTEFTTPKKLSTEQNSLYEMMYGMGLDNGNVYYAWVENTENSYFLSEGTNNIYMMEGGEKTLVQETENIVSDVVTDPENKLIVWKEVSKDDDQTKIINMTARQKKNYRLQKIALI